MQIQNKEPARDAPPMFGTPPAASGATAPGSSPAVSPPSGDQPSQNSDDDAMKRLLDSMQGDKEKKP
jgi:hypothetical protein